MIMLNVADVVAKQSALIQAQVVCDQLRKGQELLIEALTPLTSRLSVSVLLGPEPQEEVSIVPTCRAMDLSSDQAHRRHEIGFKSRTL